MKRLEKDSSKGSSKGSVGLFEGGDAWRGALLRAAVARAHSGLGADGLLPRPPLCAALVGAGEWLAVLQLQPLGRDL